MLLMQVAVDFVLKYCLKINNIASPKNSKLINPRVEGVEEIHSSVRQSVQLSV